MPRPQIFTVKSTRTPYNAPVPDDGRTDEDNEKERRTTIRKRKTREEEELEKSVIFDTFVVCMEFGLLGHVYMRKKCIAQALISSPPLT